MRHDFSDVTSRSEAERLGRLYPIILREYNPEYKALYARERDYLLDVFSGLVLRISHIGSTAVSNLISKPTIDILLEIRENMRLVRNYRAPRAKRLPCQHAPRRYHPVYQRLWPERV